MMNQVLRDVRHRRAHAAAVLLAAGLLVACGNAGESAHPSGTLEATEVDVAPLLTTRVLEVRARDGETVAEGDTLLVLDTELLQRQRAQTQARGDLLAAQTQEAGQVLQQSQRKLELAETTLERTRALRAQGSSTQQQVDDLSAARDVAASQVEAARDRQAALAAQREELQRSLEVIDRQIAEGVVRSPITGTVLLRAVEPGEVGKVGALALRLADLRRLQLRIFLQEQDLDEVRVGESLPVLVDALEGEELTGTVSWISPEAEFTPKNAQTRQARAQLVYAVKLTIANPQGRLHIGMPAAVRLDRTSE